MKEVKHFICEICGTEYNDKKVAQDCEKSHVKPKEIDSCRYLNFKQNGKYPQSIIVKMEDGTGVVYKR